MNRCVGQPQNRSPCLLVLRVNRSEPPPAHRNNPHPSVVRERTHLTTVYNHSYQHSNATRRGRRGYFARPLAHRSEAKSHNATFVNEISMRNKICISYRFYNLRINNGITILFIYTNRLHTSTPSARMRDFTSEHANVRSYRCRIM